MNEQRALSNFVQSHCTSPPSRPTVAVLHLCRSSPVERQSRLRQRSDRAEGKIKGRGTKVRVKRCLHVGWRGTRLRWPCAASDAKAARVLKMWCALFAYVRWAAPERSS